MSSASMMGGGQSYAAKREEEKPPLASSKNECVLSLYTYRDHTKDRLTIDTTLLVSFGQLTTYL